MTPRFGELFVRQVIRPTLRHPLLPTLNVLCIAAGITVFLAVQMANRGALESFRNAVSLVAGRAHLEVRGDLPEAILPNVAAVSGVKVATPIVEGIVTLPEEPGEYLRVLGVDPFTGADLRVFQLSSTGGESLDFEKWLRNRYTIASTPDRAAKGPISVVADGRKVTLDPAFVLRTDDAAVRSDPRLVAMDIGWAQELLGRRGRLTSIQILLDDPLRAVEVAREIERVVPLDATVGPPARRGAETEAMLAAFQLNLTALSLVSMVVGVFLIYNSLSATVVRRRVEIGILRANGASRAEIAALFLGEGLLAGVAGTVLGIVAATPLAAVLAAPVGQTVSSLYTLVSVEHPSLSVGQIVLAFAVGIASSLVAAWRPAAEAAACDPASVLHPGSMIDSFHLRSRIWLPLGLVSVGVAVFLSWWSLHGGGSFLGFGAVGFLIAGSALLVPTVAIHFAGLIRGRGWLARLSAQHLVRALHRNAVTIAALAIAAGMTVSVSVMIYSFRASVNSWIGQTLVADLFIAPAANEIVGLQTFVPDPAVAWARQDPRISETATFREMSVRWDGKTVSMGVIEGKARGELEFLRGLPDSGAAFFQPDHLVVSESFSTRHGTEPGDRLRMATPGGEREYIVAGVIKDFTRDNGLLLMDRRNFARYWSDDRVHSLALQLRNPADADAVASDFRKVFQGSGEFSIYTNSGLRSRVMEIFDQTFAVTSVLRGISVVVAIAGVFLSLTTLVIEREREIGVLRSIGASSGQVRALVFVEAGMIGLLASLVGVACGAGMAMILTWVINKAFFGWTIDLRYPLDVLASTPLWLVPAALAAAWLPALRAARIPPAQAIRFE
ncbi:MAG: FtsX-like permease family protein [Terrimicrobiaceae bacterium]